MLAKWLEPIIYPIVVKVIDELLPRLIAEFREEILQMIDKMDGEVNRG